MKKLLFHSCCLTPPNAQCHLVLILRCLGCFGPQASGTLPVTPLMPSSCTKQPLGGVSRAQFLPACTNLVVMANNLHFPGSFLNLCHEDQSALSNVNSSWVVLHSGNCQGSKAFQLVGTSHSSHDFSSRLSSVGSDKSCWGPAPAWHRPQGPGKTSKTGRKDDKKRLDGHSRHLHYVTRMKRQETRNLL